MQLQETIFLKQYSDYLASQNEVITIHYVENSQTANPIQWIEIKELEDIAKTLDVRIADSLPYQKLKMVQLKITTMDEAKLESIVDRTFSKAKAVFKDGTTQDFDLGILKFNSAKGRESEPLISTGSGSSSREEGFIIWEATEPVVITNVRISQEEQLQELFRKHLLVDIFNNNETVIDYVNYPTVGTELVHNVKPFDKFNLPIELAKGESLRFEYKFENLQQPIRLLQKITLDGVRLDTNESFQYVSGFVQYNGDSDTNKIAKFLKETRAR